MAEVGDTVAEDQRGSQGPTDTEPLATQAMCNLPVQAQLCNDHLAQLVRDRSCH